MSEINLNDAVFRKATKSGNGNDCVEVSTTFAEEDVILLRDSKNPDVAPFRFNRREWDAFLDGAGKGEFDL